MIDIYSVPAQVWQRFWDISIPMKEAYVRYQKPEIREKYAKLRQAGGPHHVFAQITKMADNKDAMEKANEGKPPPSGFWDGLGRVLDFYSESQTKEYREARAEYERFDKELQGYCARWINAGRLIAVGYSKNRQPQDLATFVPNDLVSYGFYSWPNSTINNTSLAMVEIRVGTPEMLRGCLEEFQRSNRYAVAVAPLESKGVNSDKSGNSGTSPEKQRIHSGNSETRPGRKSRKSEISDAYLELLRLGAFAPSAPIKSLIHPIRDHILERNPNDPRGENGLSDETIRRVVRETQQTQN